MHIRDSELGACGHDSLSRIKRQILTLKYRKVYMRGISKPDIYTFRILYGLQPLHCGGTARSLQLYGLPGSATACGLYISTGNGSLQPFDLGKDDIERLELYGICKAAG